MDHLSAKTSLYLGLFPWDQLPQAMLLSQKYFKGGLKRVNLGDWMNKTENQI